MTSMRLRASFAALVLSVLAVPTPAQARPVALPARLSLTVHEQGGQAATAAELTCHPSGGTHPRAAAACDALDTAGGDLDRAPAETGVSCYQLYLPVTAKVSGSWQGRPVRWEQTFANDCYLRVKTGPIFALGAP